MYTSYRNPSENNTSQHMTFNLAVNIVLLICI